ncbi:hypothetical protein EI555_016191 [Monodon monoceros]|uniref:Uncharacterized protein n=1 Tax=Monodon monoceros TaxID=40151 RepID=A0A4U1ETV1_MONMO|nr:hypothetical protein EI555_016191 [Monodon monoceros]
MKRSSHPKSDEQLCDSLGQADFEVRAPPRGSGLRAHLVPGPPVTKRGRDNCRQEHRGASSWRAHCVPGYLTVFTSSAPWALEAKRRLCRCGRSSSARIPGKRGTGAFEISGAAFGSGPVLSACGRARRSDRGDQGVRRIGGRCLTAGQSPGCAARLALWPSERSSR